MSKKTLSPRALFVIDQYLHFRTAAAVCSIPYYNNRTSRTRIALRADIGKGSAEEIREELQTYAQKEHILLDTLDSATLKKILADQNLGIDCSGLAYYVLNAECIERGLGSLAKNISFVRCEGIIGRIRCRTRPVENCDVATLADDANSRIVTLRDVRPGDMVTMIGKPDHILIVHDIDNDEAGVPTHISYTQAVAYPEDGLYGTGVRQGTIDVKDAEAPLYEQIWSDQNILSRAQRSRTELRRLKAL